MPCSFNRLLLLLLCLLAGAAGFAFGTRLPATSALVLYDSSGPYGWIGTLQSKEMLNLLGHFPLTTRALPVERYRAGDVNRYDVTFYLGTVYNNALSAAFLQDVMTTDRTVCWMGYNLWKIAWDAQNQHNPAFLSRFGLRFDGLDFTGYPEVQYKGQSLTKELADPTMGFLTIVDSGKTAVYATAVRTGSLPTTPYLVRGGNLWCVADDPFSYVTMTDRHLAFADVLHDVLGIAHAERHRAILRIEDVNPTSDPADLYAVADVLASYGVPYVVSVIPQYLDPRGVYSGGVPETLTLAGAPAVVNALRYMTARGGQIVQHGATHQYRNLPNPYTGVTADDYEFFRVAFDNQHVQRFRGPVPEDSFVWALSRVRRGQSLLASVNLPAVAWLTPHYLASEQDYRAFAAAYPIALDRGTYFVTLARGRFNFVNQLCPYTTTDIYHQFRVPETIGAITPNGFGVGAPSLPADLIQRAQCNLVVRDGWAAGYFHPFLDPAYLDELIQGIQGLGYEFVPVNADVMR